MILTGKLDRRIDIMVRGDSISPDTGEPIPSWLKLVRLPAEKLSKGAAERVLSVELVSHTSVVWRIRFRADITPKMRVQDREQTYRINGIYEGNNQRYRELFIACITEEPQRGGV